MNVRLIIKVFAAAWCTSVLLAACGGSSQIAPATPNGAALPISVSGRNAPAATSRSTTVTLKAAGGNVAIAAFGGFNGAVSYARNNAPHGTTLTLENGGSTNVSNAPIPHDTKPVLYLRVQVSSRVSFKTTVSQASISSSSLTSGTFYTLYLYQGKKQVGKIDAGVPSTKGVLSFPTPLANVAIAPGAPLVLELTSPSGPTPKSLLYIGSRGVEVDIYNATTLQPIGAITGFHGIGHLKVDRKRNLYVPDKSADTVSVFPPGKTSPSVVYRTDLVDPIDTAIATDGTVYVLDQHGISASQSNPSIVVYRPGSTQPSAVVPTSTSPGIALAIDSTNTVYAAVGAGDLFKLPFRSTTLVSSGWWGTIVGIAFDAAGDLDLLGVLPSGSGSGSITYLNVFPRGSTLPIQKSRTITLNGFVNELAFNTTGTTFYTAPLGLGSSTARAYRYAYPGGKLLNAITIRPYPAEIAYAPALVPGAFSTPTPSPTTSPSPDIDR